MCIRDRVVSAPDKISITFPAPVAGLDKLFDQVAVVSSHSPQKEMAVLGPYYVSDHKSGSYVELRRNPNYWKHDAAGRQLPYIDAVRLEIQSNRDIELLKFTRDDIHLINSMDADAFDRLSRSSPDRVRDAGPSLDSEQMWFNQVPSAPIPGYKLEWFQSRNFRHAISSAINREDLCKVVYNSHARPALGPVSPANRFWFDSHLQPVRFDPAAALQLLQQDGFQLSGGTLHDRGGHAVVFSIVTNAGNRSRERMATMIQQDLRSLGIAVNVVTLDFPSLIQRIGETFNYEAALLGLVNVELDPNAQMNVWLSSSDEHQWNPRQKTPATQWEAEVDRLMRAQASAMDNQKRKKYFDQVQEIVSEQLPFIYLVNKNALTGISPLLSVDLRVDYPNKPQTLRAVSFQIDQGEVLGLVGESGSGKSTIALAILRLLGLKGGRAIGHIWFRGRDLMVASERDMRRVRGREIGLVLQSPLSSLNPALKIGTQLAEAWRAHATGTKAELAMAIDGALASVGLPSDKEFCSRYPSQVSVGQAQRVLIAMAVMHSPALLLADEPTSALDAITQAEIMKLFTQLNRKMGSAVLYISHDLLLS